MGRIITKEISFLAALGFCVPGAFSAALELNWESVLNVELEPGSAVIYSIRQRGSDLAVRVLVNGELVSEQDGPDRVLGRELVVFENSSAATQQYQLDLAPLHNGLNPTFELIRWPTPSSTDIEIAKKISTAHQFWLSENDAEATLSVLRELMETQPNHPLVPHAVTSYSNALLRSGNLKLAIDFIYTALIRNFEQSNCTADSFNQTSPELLSNLEVGEFSLAARQLDDLPICLSGPSPLLYEQQLELAWLFSDALRQAGYFEVGNSVISNLIAIFNSSAHQLDLSPREEKWFQANLNISYGTILILLGNKLGDDTLKIRGGDLFRMEYRNFREDPDLFTRARLIDSLSAFYIFHSGRTNSTSQELLSQAENIYNRSGDRSLVGAIRNNQAYVELGKGNLANALELYLESLDVLAFSKHAEGQAHVRARLGYLYYVLGDYSESVSRYREANEIYEKNLLLEQKLVANKMELASVLRAMGEHEESLEQLRHVSKILNNSNEAGIEDRVRLQTQIALTNLELDNLTQAELSVNEINEFLSAREMNTASEALGSAIRLQFRLELSILESKIAIARNNYEEALEIASHSLNLIAQNESGISQANDNLTVSSKAEPLQQLELIYLRLSAFAALNREDELLQEGEAAVQLIELIRDDIDLTNSAAQWIARTVGIRDLLVSTYLSEYLNTANVSVLSKAFDLIQSAKGRSLRINRQSLLARNLNESFREASEQLNRDNQELINAELAGGPTHILESLKSNLDRSQEQFVRESMRRDQNLFVLSNITVTDVQSRLDEDSVVLSYTVGDSGSFLVGISGSNGISVWPLPDRLSLKLLIDAALREINEGSDKSTFPINTELAEKLLPLDLISNHQKLIIEADGDINKLSFSTLLDLKPVNNTRLITHTPSVSELFSSGSLQNPDFSLNSTIAIFANPSVTLNTEILNTSTNQVQRSNLVDLPFTLQEASAIEEKFTIGSKKVYLEEDSTIANLRAEESRNASILHIASHGFASQSDSEFLGLALANNMDSGESGLLTAHEISQLTFSNDLVVIGACETAVGESIRGEGIISISRAFLANGASATLSTLWPVQDRANYEFMNHFYSALVDLNLDPAHALTYAQSQFREPTSRYNSPKYWGAYVLHKVK